MTVHSMRIFVCALAVALSAPVAAQEPAKEAPSSVDLRLASAFGARCEELQRPLKVWFAQRKWLLAAGELSVVSETQVRIAPFSAAQFNAEGKVVQSIRGESAILVVDGRVNTITGLGAVKISAITVKVGGGLELPFALRGPAREQWKVDIERAIVETFGRESPELQRPIRMRMACETILIVAEKADVAKDGRSVRFEKASLAVGGQLVENIFRGEDVLVTPVNPIENWTDLWTRQIDAVEVRSKDTVIRIIPQSGPQAPTGSAPGAVGEKTVEAKDMPRPPTTEATFSSGTSRAIRFQFKIDPKTPLTDLLPAPPKSAAKLPNWRNEELGKVPELALAQPMSKELPKTKAMEEIAHAIAKVNHLNRKKTDGFLLAMLDQRADLRGLPFLMGDECRTRGDEAKLFAFTVDAIHQISAQMKENAGGRQPADQQFWTLLAQNNLMAQVQTGEFKGAALSQDRDVGHRTMVAALMQIVMPKSADVRLGFAKYLATVPHTDATKALAKLAIYSAEESVRAAAIDGLKLRRERDYEEILLQGFRYPLPAVSKRAAEALVKLERKDLLEKLVQVLEAPDPRLPTIQKRDGKEVHMVRELVKVNHHRNCLLCHAPGNTENTPDGVLKVAVPLPSDPLPKPSEGGGYQSTPPPTPDILVRIDMTYLRQDFALMMPVSEAHPWPEMQRFDFLGRTRELTAAEAQAYEPCCEAEEPGELTPYHRAALYALRELTARDAEPTPAAWRKMLRLSR